jgi:hypothetical protein
LHIEVLSCIQKSRPEGRLSVVCMVACVVGLRVTVAGQKVGASIGKGGLDSWECVVTELCR